MPALFLTCGGDVSYEQRPMFPTWRQGEWWEVVSTMATDRPMWGAPLSGLDLYHRFVVAGEETVEGVKCWRVEVTPFRLRRRLLKAYGEMVAARLWLAQGPFRLVRVERTVGLGRNLVERPWKKRTAGPASEGPLLLPDAMPTVFDLPIGPRRADESLSVPWEAGDFPDGAGGRVVRQTVHELVEAREHWRERLLKVTLSDGSVACHQVWTPGRPWPESTRTWSGVRPKVPFVYSTKLRAWSKRPYRAWIGTAFLVFGFAAQGLFTMRFVVQWIASERAKKSVIPMAFWYLSLSGGLMLLTYAIHRLDPVFILGQCSGVFIYSRNVWLRHKERRAAAGLAEGGPAEA